MKTKQEMIYEFMVALASNSKMVSPSDDYDEVTSDLYEVFARDIYTLANALATEFTEGTV